MWFRVHVGSVVVIATAMTPAGVVGGHSCVCGGSNELYGHNQGGWFSSCNHGVIGLHCHHWATRLNWYEGYELYQVNSVNVATWAAANGL